MRRNTLLLFALIFVIACNKHEDEFNPSEPNKEVSFTDGGIQFTRVTNSQFDNNDEILVKAFVGSEEYDEATYTYFSSKFTSTSPIEITDGQQFSYQAIYPSTTSFDGIHQIYENQSIAENYEQSDLLVAKVATTEVDTPELTFCHVMSSVILNIKVLDNGVAVNDASLDVTFNLKTTADINVDLENYLSSGDTKTITPYPSVGNGSSDTYNYSLIAAPQTIPANNTIATIIVNGNDKFEFFQLTDLILQSSKQYTYTLTVDITTKTIQVEFNGSIGSWEDVTDELKSERTLTDFSADNYPASADSWVITDEVATTEDFAGLRAALESLQSSERQISLSFPYLTEFPTAALSGGDSGSQKMNALISISSDVATTIGNFAFEFCYALTAVSLSEVYSIGENVFRSCEALSTVSLPKATTIEAYAFYNCVALNTISLPMASYIGIKALRSCSTLTSISLPKVTNIQLSAFSSCAALNNMEVATESKLIVIGSSIFDDVPTTNINLVIGNENDYIEVDNKYWGGYYFKSITLI